MTEEWSSDIYRYYLGKWWSLLWHNVWQILLLCQNPFKIHWETFAMLGLSTQHQQFPKPAAQQEAQQLWPWGCCGEPCGMLLDHRFRKQTSPFQISSKGSKAMTLSLRHVSQYQNEREMQCLLTYCDTFFLYESVRKQDASSNLGEINYIPLMVYVVLISKVQLQDKKIIFSSLF